MTNGHVPLLDWGRRLEESTRPLPGSEPYENVRPLRVEGRFDRCSLIEFLTQRHPHVATDQWLESIAAGNMDVDGVNIRSPAHTLRSGNQISHRVGIVTEPWVNSALSLIYNDGDCLVVNKPAPLPVHPSGRFNRNSAQRILEHMFPQWALRPVHRLDADTTGVLVFAKSKDAARSLAQQFEAQEATKTYLARVSGHTPLGRTTLSASIDRNPTVAGGRRLSRTGDDAHTEIETVCHTDLQESLLQAYPRTGRTNQLRIHLAQWGHPIVGDHAYNPAPEASADDDAVLSNGPICLHAWRLQLNHPTTGGSLDSEALAPPWWNLNDAIKS